MKKKLNVVLILVVLGLWGTVIYKYVHRFFADEASALSNATAGNVFVPAQIKKDTFALVALSHDPFLKRTLAGAGENHPKPVATPSYAYKPRKVAAPKKKEPIVVSEVPFPEVKYYGFIKSKDKAEELILIKVNTTLYKTRPNSDCQGVVIKKAYRDSLEVKFGKIKAVIRKQ